MINDMFEKTSEASVYKIKTFLPDKLIVMKENYILIKAFLYLNYLAK